MLKRSLLKLFIREWLGVFERSAFLLRSMQRCTRTVSSEITLGWRAGRELPR